MATVLTSRFPEKAAELWAYQTTIIHAAHTYEGANWVAHNHLYSREMLAAKNLHWLVPNQRLYSEAFMGRAKRHPQCPHCLSEDHTVAGCPHNPNPPFVGWFQGTPHLQFGPAASGQPSAGPLKSQEICKTFNGNCCRFTRCRYLHVCTDISSPHAAINCPNRQPSSGRGSLARSRTPHSAPLQPQQPLPVRGQPWIGAAVTVKTANQAGHSRPMYSSFFSKSCPGGIRTHDTLQSRQAL